MKNIAVVVICIFGIFQNIGFGSYVNIISQTNHIHGTVAELANEEGWVHSQGYDIIDGGSLSQMVEGWGNLAQSSAGNFQVTAYTFKDAPESGVNAGAGSTYIFTPTTSLILTISGYVTQYSGATYKLVYLDDDRWITNDWSAPLGSSWMPFYEELYLSPLHQYELQIGVGSNGSEYGDDIVELNAVFTPEPTTLLLIGLGGMLIRKFKTKSEK